jgi:hypothetical protein
VTTVAVLVADVLARVVVMRELRADGDTDGVAAILADLEADFAALAAGEEPS